ncbi:MAG: chemotaxis protein CheX [Myxococcaceae bacterium]|nr:chemotaxis protein CheX [Myxococcaceae bacterium]
MSALPSPEALAKLLSNVTSTMLGISFRPVPSADGFAEVWRTVTLPIPGARPLTVGLASDQPSCGVLSAAMFSCPVEAVDQSMMSDSLRELTNMTAGLVKSSLGLDQALGLPKVMAGDHMPACGPPPTTQSVVLKAEKLGLLLWVSEGVAA